MPGLIELLLFAAIPAASVLLGLKLGSRMVAQRRDGAALAAFAADRTEFLFDGDRLIDSTASARALIAHSPAVAGSAWVRLSVWLAQHFAGLDAALARLPSAGRVILPSSGPGAAVTLVAEQHGPLVRLALMPDDDPTPGALSDAAARDELALLREVAEGAPMPIWRETDAGAVTWANAAYLALAARRDGDGAGLTWPLPALFPGQGRGADAAPVRAVLRDEAGAETWYALSAVPMADGRLVYALPAGEAVQAEGNLKAYRQTLAQTFAHLQTGLAIFDSARRLVLFNPALADLTGLAPEMLITRPSLAVLLDAMRDRGSLPEPRNYQSWRQHLLDLETAAAEGLHAETWWLPGGRTLRLTARPHPNGALALMLEDISTEMSQSRRYRADLELGQAVVDAMPEAVAVFSAAGALVMTNAAFETLWRHDAGAALSGPADVAGLVAVWRAGAAGADLDRLAAYLSDQAPDPLEGMVTLADGTFVRLRARRLTGGATLVAFRTADDLPQADLRRTA